MCTKKTGSPTPLKIICQNEIFRILQKVMKYVRKQEWTTKLERKMRNNLFRSNELNFQSRK